MHADGDCLPAWGALARAKREDAVVSSCAAGGRAIAAREQADRVDKAGFVKGERRAWRAQPECGAALRGGRAARCTLAHCGILTTLHLVVPHPQAARRITAGRTIPKVEECLHGGRIDLPR